MERKIATARAMTGSTYELRSSEFFSDTPASEASSPPGAMVIPVPLLPGMTVSLVSFQGGADVQATAVNDHDHIHFSCLFAGPVHVAFADRNLCFEAGSLLTTYAPGERFRLRLPGEYRNVELMVTPETLSEVAGNDYQRIGEDIHQGFCVRCNRDNQRACGAAHRLARLLTEDTSRPLLIHSAALEFLAWHLQGSESHTGAAADIPLRERKLLLAARDRLLRDLDAPPTIAELSRETGLNQLKLKRGFKQIFGSSIYALFQRERMDRARQLLQDHDVTETAMLLGYSNVSHFSSAFRKQFGVLPREARRGALD